LLEDGLSPHTEQESTAVAEKPARRETVRKSAAVRRLKKLQTTSRE